MTNMNLPRAHLVVVVAALAWAATDRAAAQSPGVTRERTPVLSAFPEYPTRARRDRLEGEATVCFTIDAEGAVNRPRIRSSTHRIFQKPTLEAIKASSFEPLRPGQIESPVQTCRTYRYSLNPLDPLYVANTPAEAEQTPAAGTERLAALALDELPALSSEPDSLPVEGLSDISSEEMASLSQDTLISRARPLPLLPPQQPICSTERRSGTRIERTSCYTPTQQASIEQSKDRDLGLLQDQARSWTLLTPELGSGREHVRGNDLGPR